MLNKDLGNNPQASYILWYESSNWIGSLENLQDFRSFIAILRYMHFYSLYLWSHVRKKKVYITYEIHQSIEQKNIHKGEIIILASVNTWKKADKEFFSLLPEDF